MSEFPDNTTFNYTKIEISIDDWISESASYAQDFAYKCIINSNIVISPNGIVTEDYKVKAYDLCRLRITQGGYRLARMIEEIYGAYNKKKTELQEQKFLNE